MSMTVLRPELNILLPPNSKGGEKYLSRPRSRHAMALRSKLEEIGLVDLMLHYWLYTGYKYLVSRGPARRAQYTQLTCSLLKKAHTSTSIIFKHNTLSNLFVLLYLVKTFVSLELGKVCVPRFAILCFSTRKASQREQGANLTNEVDLVSAIHCGSWHG